MKTASHLLPVIAMTIASIHARLGERREKQCIPEEGDCNPHDAVDNCCAGLWCDSLLECCIENLGLRHLEPEDEQRERRVQTCARSFELCYAHSEDRGCCKGLVCHPHHELCYEPQRDHSLAVEDEEDRELQGLGCRGALEYCDPLAANPRCCKDLVCDSGFEMCIE